MTRNEALFQEIVIFVTILNNAKKIKNWAKALGFYECRIAEASFLEEEAPLLEKWLKNNYHGKMTYMSNHFDFRLDPTKLVPGAKSVVSLAFNYLPKEENPKNTSYKISKYAYGRDYHKVVKKKLKQLLSIIREEIGLVDGRAFVDSAPVMERSWAKKSGLGWVGKNSLILNRSVGSFFFLAELIIDLPLEPDHPVPDFCGTCTKCIDACPTDAILKDGIVDGSKCISYLTIELKDEIPSAFKSKYKDWIFGCDICQDVCPWNRFSKPSKEPDFEPKEAFKKLNDKDLEEITKEVFEKTFNGTPLRRTGLEGLKKNISFLKKP